MTGEGVEQLRNDGGRSPRIDCGGTSGAPGQVNKTWTTVEACSLVGTKTQCVFQGFHFLLFPLEVPVPGSDNKQTGGFNHCIKQTGGVATR